MSKMGIYVEMAHHPQVVLDAMAGMRGAVTFAGMLQSLMPYVPWALLIIGCAGLSLAVLLGGGGLGCLLLLCWIPIVAGVIPLFLVSQGRANRSVQRFARKGAWQLLLLGLAGLLYFSWLEVGLPITFIFFAVGAMGMILLLVFRGRHIPHIQEHFEAARQILHTLRDDTGRKGRVVGWLDLTGPQRKEKIVRTARTRSGRRKVYYRDPWFRVKFKLADGNLLRLTLEDKVKTKPGSIVRQTQYSAKLVVNPSLYRLGQVPTSAVPVTNATLAHEDGIFVVKAVGPAKDLSAQQVLQSLKAVYSHLEPIGLEPVGSELPPAGTAGATEV